MKIADETVNVALSGCLMNDVLVVVIPKTSTELLVVHFWFVLTDSPSSCDLRILGKLTLLQIHL